MAGRVDEVGAGVRARTIVLGGLVLCVILALPLAMVESWALVPLVLAGAALAARFPTQVAFVCLLVGPMLLSPWSLGGLTLDNLASAAGAACVVLAALIRGAVPFTRLSAFPLALGIAFTISDLFNGLSFTSDLIRFVSIALIPWLVDRTSLGTTFVRWVTLATAVVGGFSLLLQPVIGFPAPFTDTETAALRYGGLFGHPNFAAYCLGVLVIVLLLQARIGHLELLATGVLTIAMIVTGARTAILILAAMLALFLLRRFGRLLLGSLAAFILLLLAGGTFLSRLDVLGGESSGGGALTWRSGQWSSALGLLPGNELWGIGRHQIEQQLGNGLGAHNGYVEILVEAGFLGSAIILAGLIVSLTGIRGGQPALVAWLFVLATSLTDPALIYPSTLTVLLIVSSQRFRRDHVRDDLISPSPLRLRTAHA